MIDKNEDALRVLFFLLQGVHFFEHPLVYFFALLWYNKKNKMGGSNHYG